MVKCLSVEDIKNTDIYKEIYNDNVKANPHERSQEVFESHVAAGSAVEAGLIIYYGLTKNTKNMIWDAENNDGKTYEIKSDMRYNGKWWNMSTDYGFFKQHHKSIDCIMLGTIKNGFVYGCAVAAAPTFYNYVQKSSGYGYYYNIYQAEANKQVVVL